MAVNNEHKLNIHLNAGPGASEQFGRTGGITITTHSIPVGQTPPRRSSIGGRLSESSSAATDNGIHSNSLGDMSPSSDTSSGTSSVTPTPEAASPRSQPSPVKTPSPRLTDLSVKSVLLSEFSASDRLKYIERSNIIPGKQSTLVLNRQEFCINI